MSTIFELESDGFHGNENEDSECINTSFERVKSLRTTRTAISLAVVVMMVLVSAAVMISSSADKVPPEMADISAITDGYVRVGLVSAVVNWNPLIAEMEEDYMMSSLIYSSLFTYDEDWGGPVNDLATGWYQEVDPVDDSMITYINITHNSYFNDLDDLTGTSHQLTAQDVEFTFNLMKSETGYTYDWYLLEVTVLGTANATGTGSFQDQIQLWTPYPKATLIDDITSVPILPMYLWEYYSNPFAGMQPTQLVGSGPFVFEDWLKGGWYKFKTAPNYHGSLTHPGEDRTVDVNGLLYTIYSGGDPLCVAVNMGIEDVVGISGYTSAFLYILGNQANVNVYKAAVSEIGICDVAINAVPPSFIDHEGGLYGGGNPVLLDPFVRQAIMMTLNKQYICDVLLHGLAVRGSSVVQPGYWQADIDEMPFDPDAARDLLINHGWSTDLDGDGYLEATASAYAVQMGYVGVGTELSGIRCQAPDTDKTYEYVALSWKGEAEKAGIQLIPSVESEMTMINQAWYNCDYDIWVWHWGWGPEPIGGALTIWLTELIKEGGDNCQMPMGEWWYGWDNYTEAPTTWTGRGETIEFTPQGPYSSFDQNISIAMETLDKAERKVILDELQQAIYDSYCENPPFYDLGLYGYTDYRFTNWGDFEAHPGRAFTSALCWLWFDLEPIGDNLMPVFDTPPLPFYEAEVGVPITFTIGVSDPEGDPIGVNWSFGDGGTNSDYYLTGDTTVERLISVTHVYTEVADGLTLTISLNDAPQHTTYTIATAQVNVLQSANSAPAILYVQCDPESALVSQEVTWTAWAMDHEQGPDGDGLLFHWDWDDGTYTSSLHQPVANDTPVADTQTHVWTEAGIYVVTVCVIDGPNNVSVTMPYTVVMLQEGFVMAQIGGPQTLDPATDYESYGGEVIQNVYETLVFYDEAQPDLLVPVLTMAVPSVENGLISPDGMTYTFPLKHGVLFHDGTEMTSDDVAYSIQRVLRIHDPTGPAWMLEQVMTHYISFYVGSTIQDWINSEGVTEPWLLDALPSDTSTVIEEEHMTAVAEAVVYADGDDVVFRLTTPYPGFLHILATTVASVVSMDYVEANGGITNGDTSQFMEQNMCGTGPYMLQSWDIGSNIHLARFNDYWGDAPELEDVYIVTVNDVYDRIQMLQDGIADSAYIPIGYEHLFEGDDYRIVKGIPTFNMAFAGFNFDINTEAAAVYGSDVPSDFFHDVHVRRAFTHMMDYDLFLESVLDGNGIQPNGAIPKGMFGYDEDVPKYQHSLELAQDELKAAINEDTGNSWYEDGFEIALIYNAGNIYRQTACELMEDTLEDMGSQFTVNVVALDWPTYLNELHNASAPFPMFWLGWAPDYADPDNYMTPFLDSVFGIYPYSTGYANTTIDDIIREAGAELDNDTRAELYSEASMLVYEDAPYIWMYQANNFHVERSWVTGYYFHPMLHGLDYAALGTSTTPVNSPPVASFTVAPEATYVGGTVMVDASSSYDLEDPVTALEVRWDWENDGVWDTDWTTEKTAYHQLLVAGEHTIVLEVRDSEGLTDDATHAVQAFDGSFVQGEFPDRVFTIVKSSDSRGPVKLDSKMKTLEDYDWWLELTQMDGTKVIVDVYNSRAASNSLVSTSVLTSVGDASEHIQLEAGAVYRVVMKYYGQAGIAELKEVAIPSTPVKYHEPILINGDDDFVPENGVVGGSGTYENPYIIAGWVIESAEGSGITVMATTKYFTIQSSRITGDVDTCMYGVHLENVEHATLQGLDISGFWMGVYAKLTDDLTVTGSQITWCSWGVSAVRCGSISVTDSEVSHNRVGSGNHDGIAIQETDYAYVARNNLVDNWNGVFTYIASNVHISDNTMAQTGVGIQALYTDGLVVSGNSIASMHFGIILVDCPDTIIESNTVTTDPSASDAYFGIAFMSCVNLRVSSNIVDSYAHGIGTRDDTTPYPMSENVVISGNKIYNCSDSAVRIQRVSNMTVTANAFLLNGVGVHVSPTAYEVRIYHNDFLYNSVQAIEDPYCVGIEWDDGYPSGGNFWSDYTGVDLYSGVNQDGSGSDGIGDSPYTMGVVDRYPYMEPICDW